MKGIESNRWAAGFARYCLIWSVPLFLALTASGCHSGNTKDAASQRIQKLTFVSKMPEHIQSIRSAYESLQAEQVVTIAGKIYAESVSPFDPNESSFTVIELPKPGHNHEDPGDCPFCKRELRDAKIAIVKVVDESGNSIQQPADKLLGLKRNQDVAVTGSVSAVGDTLILHASRLHILSKEDSKALSESFHNQASDSQASETQ